MKIVNPVIHGKHKSRVERKRYMIQTKVDMVTKMKVIRKLQKLHLPMG